MGKRGSIAGSTSARRATRTPEEAKRLGNPGRRPLKAATATVATLVPIASSAPPVPDGIDGPNIERWREIWSSAPWLSVTLDSEAVREYLECIVERDEMRGSITELGMVQEEPIVSTRGQVVGHRQVHHPLLAHLRRLEARIDQARERLGLSPGSRARLGLVEIELRERAGRLTNPKTAWRKPEERTK